MTSKNRFKQFLSLILLYANQRLQNKNVHICIYTTNNCIKNLILLERNMNNQLIFQSLNESFQNWILGGLEFILEEQTF